MPQPRPDVQIDDGFPERKPFGYYAKRAIIQLIEKHDDPDDRKDWAEIAVSQGVITEEEAAELCRPRFFCPMCGTVTRNDTHPGCNWRITDRNSGFALWSAKK